MAQIVLGMAVPHSGMLGKAPEEWLDDGLRDHHNQMLWFRNQHWHYDDLEKARKHENLKMFLTLEERQARARRTAAALDELRRHAVERASEGLAQGHVAVIAVVVIVGLPIADRDRRIGEMTVGIEPVLEGGQEQERHSRESWRKRNQAIQQLEAGHHRHAYVRQHQIRHDLQDRRQAFAAVVSEGHLVTTVDQFLGDQGRGFTIILDTKDLCLRLCHQATGHPKYGVIGAKIEAVNRLTVSAFSRGPSQIPISSRRAGHYILVFHSGRPSLQQARPRRWSGFTRQPHSIRHAFTDGVRRRLDALRDLMPGPSPSARRRRAVATLAGLVGALMLARAVDDPELSDEILKAARTTFAD